MKITIGIAILAIGILLILSAAIRAKHRGGVFLHPDFARRKVDSIGAWSGYASGFLIILGVWIILSDMRPTGYTRVPSPLSVLDSLIASTLDLSLPQAIWKSLQRVAVGFTLAGFLGTVIGFIGGSFLITSRAILPMATFFRYIPPTAFVALLVVYFGIGQSYKVAVVFIGVFFFIIQMTVDAVRQVDKAYLEMALVSGIPQRRLLDKVIVKACGPAIVDLLRVNLSGAWTFLVLAEVVGADGGLGYMVAQGQRFGRIESAYSAIIVFGVIGLLTDFALQRVRSVLFPWANSGSAHGS